MAGDRLSGEYGEIGEIPGDVSALAGREPENGEWEMWGNCIEEYASVGRDLLNISTCVLRRRTELSNEEMPCCRSEREPSASIDRPRTDDRAERSPSTYREMESESDRLELRMLSME